VSKTPSELSKLRKEIQSSPDKASKIVREFLNLEKRTTERGTVMDVESLKAVVE